MFLVLLCVAVLALLYVGKKHQQVQWGHAWVNWLDGVIRWLILWYHGLHGDGLAHLPAQGSAILVCNHVSGLDPLVLIAAAHRPIRFMIAREEYERPGLNWLFRQVGCIPVDRTGRPEQALREAIRSVQSGEVVALFPHGRIVDKGEVAVPLKAGAIRLAMKTDTPIYPAHLSGVRGQGWTFLALFVPGKVKLTVFAPIAVSGREQQDIMAELDVILNDKAKA